MHTITPVKLFLLDSIGALFTAFMFGFVLRKLEAVFGLPREVLFPLAIIAIVYSVFSFVCFLRAGKHWRKLWKGIAIANALYLVITMLLV